MPSTHSTPQNNSAPELRVEAVNLKQRLALLSNGTTVPVVSLFALGGLQTQDPDEAFAFVAGEGGMWFHGALSDFERVDPRTLN